MKRLCFDTESSYYMPSTIGNGPVEAHREYFRNKRIRFDCAVVYDAETNEYHEFTSQTVSELIDLLKSADELISHSGPHVDLIVLEHACGEDRVAPLREIKHHDLREMCSWVSLDDLTSRYAPERIPECEAERKVRREAAIARGEDSFVAGKLAKAHFDVQRTYAVFLKLQAGAPRRDQ